MLKSVERFSCLIIQPPVTLCSSLSLSVARYWAKTFHPQINLFLTYASSSFVNNCSNIQYLHYGNHIQRQTLFCNICDLFSLLKLTNIFDKSWIGSQVLEMTPRPSRETTTVSLESLVFQCLWLSW